MKILFVRVKVGCVEGGICGLYVVTCPHYEEITDQATIREFRRLVMVAKDCPSNSEDAIDRSNEYLNNAHCEKSKR